MTRSRDRLLRQLSLRDENRRIKKDESGKQRSNASKSDHIVVEFYNASVRQATDIL